jgi:hypothetical protein
MEFNIAFVELGAGSLFDRVAMKKKSLFLPTWRAIAVEPVCQKVRRRPTRHLHYPVSHQEFDAVHGR